MKAKKPIKKIGGEYGIRAKKIYYFCPKCKNDVGLYVKKYRMSYQDKFCRECGQRIDWSEEE